MNVEDRQQLRFSCRRRALTLLEFLLAAAVLIVVLVAAVISIRQLLQAVELERKSQYQAGYLEGVQLAVRTGGYGGIRCFFEDTPRTEGFNYGRFSVGHALRQTSRLRSFKRFESLSIDERIQIATEVIADCERIDVSFKEQVISMLENQANSDSDGTDPEDSP